MNVSLLCPSPEYVLDERFMKAALENAAAIANNEHGLGR